MSEDLVDLVGRMARAICRSKTCEGVGCCQWPANTGRRHNCPADKGGYNDAARAAINAIDPGLLDGTSVVVPVEASPRMLAAALPLFEPPTDEDQVTASEALALLPPVGAKGREDGIFAAAELARDYRIMLTVAKQENGQ